MDNLPVFPRFRESLNESYDWVQCAVRSGTLGQQFARFGEINDACKRKDLSPEALRQELERIGREYFSDNEIDYLMLPKGADGNRGFMSDDLTQLIKRISFFRELGERKKNEADRLSSHPSQTHLR